MQRPSHPARIPKARPNWRRALPLVATICLAGPVDAACRAESGATAATLVELYTSEGCDSCPPADRWLATLRGAAGVVPLAFHVDYWDQLGWRDPFATPAFTRRQKARAATSGARFLYTPQVVVAGRDFTAWRRQPAAAELARRPAAAAEAGVGVEAEALADGRLRIRVKAELRPPAGADRGSAVAYVALYENGLVSDVKAGENRGSRLPHDFVVREWIGPLAFAADGRLDVQRELRRADVTLDHAGLAAIVESPGSGRVLQAVNLPLSWSLCR